MMRIDGRQLGRWSLRIDAAYCALLGVGVALFSAQIAEGVALPQPLIAAVGITVVVWAGSILWMLARLPLRFALRLVMIANLLAAVAVAFTSIAAATVLVIAAIVAIAIDIALFATSQAIALRALPARA
ncbi:hypothetical protein OED01_00195 [Microbacterium sp. M28]|uniref:hypothetical protein n=1 Tax=Microbacterium sp. M28 TaxID=2962064 RepID=UPI0021F44633|nr:hypothetical protein [Microbacterium sp. M28]UYO97186.1 hypothetical protein OED01_00195 [Microbacterium sp. M28]